MNLKTLCCRASSCVAGLGTAFLLFGGATAQAQVFDCNAAVVDNAHILTVGGDNIRAAIDKLVNAGADPRVITDNPRMTPEQFKDAWRRACPSWQSSSGGMKNNLIVFLVFPAQRQIGVFMGSEYTGVLQSDVLRMQYMAPSFRDREWALGFVKGIDQAAIQIRAHQEAALHPALVTQQPTDFHGLWLAFYWIIGILTVSALIWLVFYILAKRSAIKDAQQAAADSRNDIAQWLQKTLEWLETKEALGVNVATERARYEAAAEDFARVSQSEVYNPDTKGLSESQYLTIKGRYTAIRVLIQGDPIPLKRKGHSGNTRYTPAESQVSGGNVTQNVTQRIYVGGNPSVVDPVFIPVPIVEEPYVPTPAYYAPPDPPSSGGWGGSSGGFGSDDNSGFGGGDSGSFDSGSSDSGGGDSGGF